MALQQKAFSDIITFSRSSNATRIGPDGTVQYAPHNLITYSEQFDNAAWTANNSTVSANAIASPSGTVTGDRLTEDSNNTDHKTRQTFTFTAVPQTFSAYVKAAERTCVALQAYDGTTLFGYIFNLATGGLGSRVSGSSTNVTGAITAVGNGWYRCSITFTPAAAVGLVSVGLASNTTTVTYTGDGASGAYFWGAQLSVGSIAGDYTPTTSAAVYGPRFDYDPVTLAAKGLLIEEQRTNLITYSEDLSNAAWAKTAYGGGTTPVVTANYDIAPDGTNTADRVVFVSPTSSDQSLISQTPTTTSGSYTGSFYIKAATSSDVGKILGFRNVAGGSFTLITLTSQWVRVTLTETRATDNFEINLRPGVGTSSGTVSALIWGAQLEAGAFATSYIPTVASTVTRSADVATVNTLSPWYNAVEGTLFVQADVFAAYDIADLVELGDGGYNNRSFVFTAASGNVAFAVDVSGTRQAALSGGFVSNTPFKISAAYKANDFAASINGATATTDTSGSVPTVTALYLGRQGGGGGNLNGHLRRVAYYPRRLTNAELQTLSA